MEPVHERVGDDDWPSLPGPGDTLHVLLEKVAYREGATNRGGTTSLTPLVPYRGERFVFLPERCPVECCSLAIGRKLERRTGELNVCQVVIKSPIQFQQPQF